MVKFPVSEAVSLAISARDARSSEYIVFRWRWLNVPASGCHCCLFVGTGRRKLPRFSSLLHCAVLLLLYCCAVVLLHCCAVALLCSWDLVLLYCCAIALLYCCTVVQCIELLAGHYAAEAETLNGTCLQNDATQWKVFTMYFFQHSTWSSVWCKQLQHSECKTIALVALDVCGGEVWQLHSMCVKCDVVHRVVHRVVHSVWQCTLVWLSERAPGCLWQLRHAAFLKETKISHFLLGKN